MQRTSMAIEMKKEMDQLIECHILRDLLRYEKKKIPWINQLYNLSTKKKVDLTAGQIETLVKTLNQLSQDKNEMIRQKAISSLANFAMKSEEFVAKCADMDVLENLHNSFFTYDRESQAAVLSLLGAFCRRCRSEEVVYAVTKLRLLDFALLCLSSLDEHVAVAAAGAMYDMVLHVKLTLDLAKKGLFDMLALIIMDDMAGALARTQPLVALVRRASEHSQPVPHTIVKSGCLGLVAGFFYHPDVDFKKLALGTIMNIGQVSLNYVTPLFGPHLLCDIVSTLMCDNVEMKFYAAQLICKITENSRMQMVLMLENGLLEALLFHLQTALYRTDPSFIALDNVLSSSLGVTERFVDLKGHIILSVILHQDCSEYVIFSIIKILTDIFNRGEPYSTLIANLDIYERLVELYKEPKSSPYLRSAISNTCKVFLDECTEWKLIKTFFMVAPRKLLRFVIPQFSQVLPISLEERKAFLEMNGLQRILSLDTRREDPLNQHVEIIKACYPIDIINFFSPGFQQTICSKIDNYSVPSSKYMSYMSKDEKRDKRLSDIEEKFENDMINYVE